VAAAKELMTIGIINTHFKGQGTMVYEESETATATDAYLKPGSREGTAHSWIWRNLITYISLPRITTIAI
jgi:hypothetical protein